MSDTKETRSSIEKVEDTSSSSNAHTRRGPLTPEEKQAALEAALAVDPGPAKWGLRALQVSYHVLLSNCVLLGPDVSHCPRRLLLLW